MEKNAKLIILIAGLVGLLGGAGLAYSTLSREYTPQQSAEIPETTPAETAAPETAPDFVMLNEDGDEVRLADFVGEPVLINFWATWCPPCQAELPAFQKAYDAYGDIVRFMIVDETDGVRDTVESAKKFALEHGYAFPLYFDTQGSGMKAYSVVSIPMTIFVNAEGVLTYQYIGALSEEDLFAVLERQMDISETERS